MTDSSNSGVANGSSNMEIGHSNQELILDRKRRRTKKWIIAGVVAAVVIALIIAAVVLLRNGSNHKSHAEPLSAESIDFNKLISYKYNPASFNGTWVSGNQFIYSNKEGDLVMYNLDTRSISGPFIYSNDSLLLRAIDFDLSADQKYLLVSYDYQKVYRHSFRARYLIINLETGQRTDLLVENDVNSFDLFLAKWGPVGNSLVLIYENNLYYKKTAESNDIVVLTNSLKTGYVYNGMPDWVYEEEVFSSNKAFWFSPDGKKLAYIRFNDTDVPLMVVPIYGEPGSIYFQYPRGSVIKYPKAGAPNPTINLFVYDFETSTTTELKTPSDLLEQQPIITAVKWATNNSIIAYWMNRIQNQCKIVFYKELASEPMLIKSVSESSGWVELFVPPTISEDGTKIALLLSKNQGEEFGYYRHLALLDVKENSEEMFLTNGTHVVTEIIGWNHDENLIFYTATIPTDSSVQHVYSVSPTTKKIECLTCNTMSKNGNSECLYNTAEASTDVSHIVLTCSGPDIPHSVIITANGTEKLEVTKNEDLIENLKGKTIPGKLKLEFEIAEGFTAKVLLRLPANFDSSGRTKYPMLVNVYGGPDTYQVTDKFSLDWGSFIAVNKSIIYAAIDGRASGLRGNNLLFAGYRNLGTVEIIDQLNVTRIMQETLPYIDASRTAIWGWSYGGYAAGMALGTDTKNIFKCGISVAPVTDWTLYDSIYTERFMGLPTPEDNLRGYDQSQLLKQWAGIKGKEYFLIHGTFDDNVHYQQSMMWTKVLEKNDVLFRQLSYPDQDHSLASVRTHLYHSIGQFLDDCFAKDS